MVELSVVQPDESQWPKVSAAIDVAFFSPVAEDESSRDKLRPMDRRFALMSGDQVQGGCISYVFELVLPGGARVPAAGLAGVGILPTAQGRGGMRLLLEAHLNNCREHGDAVSVLMSSESGLYGRFGYAAATEWVAYRLDTRAFALKEPLDDRGCIELLSDELEARTVCGQIHAAQNRAGELQRDSGWWQEVINSDKRSWLGGGDQFVAVHRDQEGKADAYALYVIEEIKTTDGVRDGNQRSRVVLRELVTLSTQAQAVMFQYLCNIAWVQELVWELAPSDPPIKHLMSDARQLAQISRCDMLWLRVLDMPRLLMERAYAEEDFLEFDYVDERYPDQSGGFRLTTNIDDPKRNLIERLDVGGVERLCFGPEQLGAIVLGGTRAITLYQLGQITGEEAQARRLDKLLLTDEVPFNLSKF